MRSLSKGNDPRVQSAAHMQAAGNCFNSASAHAEAGDLAAAAGDILKALAQERRAGVVGPQVLQLIKN